MQVRRKIALLGLAGALAGCGAGAAPTALPRVSAQAVGFEPPAVAQADTPAGAAAFVRHFYAQVTSAYATGSSARLRALSLPGCRVCLRYAASVDGMRASKQRATPVLFWIRFAESPSDDDAATARVDLQYDAPASSRYAADGRRVLAEKALFRVNRVVTLSRIGQAWKVASIA